MLHVVILSALCMTLTSSVSHNTILPLSSALQITNKTVTSFDELCSLCKESSLSSVVAFIPSGLNVDFSEICECTLVTSFHIQCGPGAQITCPRSSRTSQPEDYCFDVSRNETGANITFGTHACIVYGTYLRILSSPINVNITSTSFFGGGRTKFGAVSMESKVSVNGTGNRVELRMMDVIVENYIMIGSSSACIGVVSEDVGEQQQQSGFESVIVFFRNVTIQRCLSPVGSPLTIGSKNSGVFTYFYHLDIDGLKLMDVQSVNSNGGALFLCACYGTLRNVKIVNSRSGIDGGGVAVRRRSNCTFVNLWIENSSSLGDGGAFDVSEECTVLVANMTTLDTLSKTDGGSIALSGSTGNFANISVSRARSGDMGGAIAFRAFSSGSFENVVVLESMCQNSGGAVYIAESNLTVTNITTTYTQAEAHGGSFFSKQRSIVTVNTARMKHTFARRTGGAIAIGDVGIAFYFNVDIVNSSSIEGGGSISARDDSRLVIHGLFVNGSRSDLDGGVGLSNTTVACSLQNVTSVTNAASLNGSAGLLSIMGSGVTTFECSPSGSSSSRRPIRASSVKLGGCFGVQTKTTVAVLRLDDCEMSCSSCVDHRDDAYEPSSSGSMLYAPNLIDPSGLTFKQSVFQREGSNSNASLTCPISLGCPAAASISMAPSCTSSNVLTAPKCALRQKSLSPDSNGSIISSANFTNRATSRSASGGKMMSLNANALHASVVFVPPDVVVTAQSVSMLLTAKCRQLRDEITENNNDRAGTEKPWISIARLMATEPTPYWEGLFALISIITMYILHALFTAVTTMLKLRTHRPNTSAGDLKPSTLTFDSAWLKSAQAIRFPSWTIRYHITMIVPIACSTVNCIAVAHQNEFLSVLWIIVTIVPLCIVHTVCVWKYVPHYHQDVEGTDPTYQRWRRCWNRGYSFPPASALLHPYGAWLPSLPVAFGGTFFTAYRGDVSGGFITHSWIWITLVLGLISAMVGEAQVSLQVCNSVTLILSAIWICCGILHALWMPLTLPVLNIVRCVRLIVCGGLGYAMVFTPRVDDGAQQGLVYAVIVCTWTETIVTTVVKLTESCLRKGKNAKPKSEIGPNKIGIAKEDFDVPMVSPAHKPQCTL